ncbi:MAG: hypothetical protein H7Y02_06485 [Candidatus Obscuribacterales bacterium]|nr:hypothetical protein [Steroidobacteraceae bacterium]
MHANDGIGTSVALIAVISLGAALSGCGGGGGDENPALAPAPVSPPQGPTDQVRAQAAAQTATNTALCTAIQPFYWEIGDRNSMLTGGTSGGATPTAITSMAIASSSKWMFGAYVVQLRNGSLTANDIAALTMFSGYTNLKPLSCQASATVDDCFTANNISGNNADLDPAAVGKFHYNGGHFQWLADTDLQLGTKTNATLQTAMAAQLGMDFSFTFGSPQLAGGIHTTAQDYGFFLRKILGNQLIIRDQLGTNAVCTNPLTCGLALYTPIPSAESWHYSLGHWVEDDPVVGDGAFSSAGAFGFYPWIDAAKTYYGIIARQENIVLGSNDPIGFASAQCGRKIRKAWVTGTTQ